MSKTIKVNDQVYGELEQIRDKRETFSEVVQRLLKVFATLKEVSDTLGPAHYLREQRDSFGRSVKSTNR